MTKSICTVGLQTLTRLRDRASRVDSIFYSYDFFAFNLDNTKIDGDQR